MAMLMAGDIDFYFQNTGTAKRALEEGTVKDLAIFSEERSSLLPDVPHRQGTGRDDTLAYVVRGFAYPKGIDSQVIEKMKAAMKNAMQSDEYIENMESLYLEPAVYEDQEFYDLLSSQLDTRLAVWGLTKK